MNDQKNINGLPEPINSSFPTNTNELIEQNEADIAGKHTVIDPVLLNADPSNWATSSPIKDGYPINKRRPTTKANPSAFAISQAYASGKFTTEAIAKSYGITARQVQRIATKYNVIRSQAEANRIAAPFKAYHRLPKDQLVQRKQLSRRDRYDLLSAQPWCTLCGNRASGIVRLEVDHKDGNPSNNDAGNLQVLCQTCNVGKSNR